MNKKTTIVIAIFVILFLVFVTWNRFYSPLNKSGRCNLDTDCAVREPEPGYYYVCEENKCVGKELGADKRCSGDEDCTAATCCHASDAVNLEYAPDCTDMFCTQECEAGTLDCGQGEIKCVNGKCEAIVG